MTSSNLFSKNKMQVDIVLQKKLNLDDRADKQQSFKTYVYPPIVNNQQVFLILIFTEKLRLFAHVVCNLSHKGIARRALPAFGGKGAVGGIKM